MQGLRHWTPCSEKFRYNFWLYSWLFTWVIQSTMDSTQYIPPAIGNVKTVFDPQLVEPPIPNPRIQRAYCIYWRKKPHIMDLCSSSLCCSRVNCILQGLCSKNFFNLETLLEKQILNKKWPGNIHLYLHSRIY